MTIDYVGANARLRELWRLAPGAVGVAYPLGRRLGYSERVVESAWSRFYRILARIAGKRSSPLGNAEIEALVERCLASLNERLVSFLQEIDPTLEAEVARRILDLPEHKLVRPSVSGPSSAARSPTSSEHPSPPAAAAFGRVRPGFARAGGIAPRNRVSEAIKIVVSGRVGLR